MNARSIALLALAAALAGSCSGRGQAPSAAQAIPVIQYRTNPSNVPGYVSTCSGGQPKMDYNCPEDRNAGGQ